MAAKMNNRVQLICYADRMGGAGLAGLRRLLDGPLQGLFYGVHILPFFLPIDGFDAGFDPIDHTRVDPRIGNWDDIKTLSDRHEVMADVIVNHVSAGSHQFQDYLRHGKDSQFCGMFLTRDSVFPRGATEAELRAIYRPRPGLPFTTLRLQSGAQCDFWTTFTPNQVDIDVHHPQGAAYLDGILQIFAQQGIRLVRFDAIGYAIKKAGTSCFMLPETFKFIADLTLRARARGLQVLVEVHSHYRKQIEIAACVDHVYDFALPPLILHAIAFRNARYLSEWIRIRPANCFNVLDTHDGIGIIDIGADPADRANLPGLIPAEEQDLLVEWIHEKSAGASRKATGAAASNLDLYQINCTFYEALGRDDRLYLIARAIQLFLPGIPQVYYVGLLAGLNDVKLLEATGVGRDINRHYYSMEEIAEQLRRPVVQQLCELIQLRNQHPAFAGQFDWRTEAGELLNLQWRNGAASASLRVDLVNACANLHFTDGGEHRNIEIQGQSANAHREQ
jgi:sucrose phosphorylase